MSARTYFMKRVKDCKDVSIMSSQEEQSRKFTLFVYYNFLVLLSTPVCSQNINKQNVNIADETLSAFSDRACSTPTTRNSFGLLHQDYCE